MRKQNVLTVTAVSLCFALHDPTPRPESVVQLTPELRITVLEDELLRVEYAGTKSHHDLPTSAVVNRRFPAPQELLVWQEDGANVIHIQTRSVSFAYDTRRGLWPEGLLDLSLRNAPYSRFDPTIPHLGNLGGTIRTLDGSPLTKAQTLDCSLFRSRMQDEKDEYHCANGVLSTTGIAVLNDTGMPVFADITNPNQPRENPNADGLDLYFFCHGSNFQAALKSFTKLSGPAPLPPRYAFGIWFTRWYGYNDGELREQVERFEESGVFNYLLYRFS